MHNDTSWIGLIGVIYRREIIVDLYRSRIIQIFINETEKQNFKLFSDNDGDFNFNKL